MHHRISTLCYRLLEGPICLEPLRVLALRADVWHDRQIRCYILGASHAVCLERHGAQLTEMLTCLPPQEESRALIERNASVSGEICIEAHGLTCQVHLAPFAMQAGEELQGDFPPENRMEIAYPAPAGEQTAFTRLGWRANGAQLHVETVHTYPEEGRGIRSWSIFTRTEEAS